MENLFESIIWLVIMVFFWLIPTLTKKTKQPREAERQPYSQPPPASPSWQEREALEKKLRLLETLGLRFPMPLPETYPLHPPPVAKKKHEPHPVVAEKKTISEIKPAAPAVVKTKEEAIPVPLVFSSDKLQEGIILSIVLGPPKSSVFMPGCWNGRQSGLKNR